MFSLSGNVLRKSNEVKRKYGLHDGDIRNSIMATGFCMIEKVTGKTMNLRRIQFSVITCILIIILWLIKLN